jgi:hemerythrin superfamily protein
MGTIGGLLATPLIVAPEVLAQNAAAPAPNGDVIAGLEQDHQQIRSLLQQIQSTQDAAQREPLFHQLGSLLTIHNAVEENLVYPALQDISKRPQDAAQLYRQQDDSKVLFFALDALPKNSPEFNTQFVAFRNAVLAHIEQEERTDFPIVRSTASQKLADLTSKANLLRTHFSMA